MEGERGTGELMTKSYRPAQCVNCLFTPSRIRQVKISEWGVTRMRLYGCGSEESLQYIPVEAWTCCWIQVRRRVTPQLDS
jgi:hypothetical protein